jgi:parvulin-like peptidyl-prolyl isomerase
MTGRGNGLTKIALRAFLGVASSALLFGQQTATPRPPAQSRAKPAATPAAKKPAASSAAPAKARTTASSAKPTEATDKVVLKVGEQQITQGDLDYLVSKLNPDAQQALARQGRRPLGEQYALMLMLSERAKSHHAETTADFRRQVELFKLQTLARSEYEAISKQAVLTPEDIKQYYSSHSAEFEEAQVRQVVIRKKADDAAAEVPGLTAADAKTRAGQIRKALAAGGDANKVVQEFSQPNIVLIEAQPRAVRHGQLSPDLDKVAFQLKDGEVSEPLETPQALVFLQKVGRRQPGLQDVTTEIEDRLRQEKVEETLAELRSKTSIWMDDAYFAPPPATPAAPEATKPADNPSPQQ